MFQNGKGTFDLQVFGRDQEVKVKVFLHGSRRPGTSGRAQVAISYTVEFANPELAERGLGRLLLNLAAGREPLDGVVTQADSVARGVEEVAAADPSEADTVELRPDDDAVVDEDLPPATPPGIATEE